mgnify:CR=1 FL=1
MSVIQSRVDVGSELYAQNRAGMLARIEAWRAIEAKGRQEEESKRERFRKRRQILPRERVHLMLDRGSPWLELATLCGYKQHDDKDGSLAGGKSPPPRCSDTPYHALDPATGNTWPRPHLSRAAGPHSCAVDPGRRPPCPLGCYLPASAKARFPHERRNDAADVPAPGLYVPPSACKRAVRHEGPDEGETAIAEGRSVDHAKKKN